MSGASPTPLPPGVCSPERLTPKFKPRCPGSRRPVFHYIPPRSHLQRTGELKDQAGSGHHTKACFLPHLVAIQVNAMITGIPGVAGLATWSLQEAAGGGAFPHQLIQLCPALSGPACGPKLTGHSGIKI